MTRRTDLRGKHRPRTSGVGIRQVFGDHPWRARLRAAMEGKPSTKEDAARETTETRAAVSA